MFQNLEQLLTAAPTVLDEMVNGSRQDRQRTWER